MIRVRFAPSPTGYLHLGNMRTALFNYLFSKQAGGKFVLRVEDTDRERSREEFLKSQMEDLRWMGILWDEGPDVSGNYGPYRQSERMEIYQSYIRKLLESGDAYYCYVTEEETEEMKTLARLEKKPPRFDNRGRSFSKQEIEARKARGIKPTVRFKIENPQLSFIDMIRGEVSFNLDDMVGDFVIQRADGMPTFHLAVCVDDGLMKITHVIRGEDHLSNTPKHLLLLKAMGLKPPEYGHLSLVHGPGGEPLSKRLSSVSIHQFRKQGYLPHALANYICLLGWGPSGNREILSAKQLTEEFDVRKVSKSASNFDPHKLDWVNGQHLRLLSDEEFTEQSLAYLKANELCKEEESFLRRVLPVFKDNVERFDQLEARLNSVSDDFVYEDLKLLNSPAGREILKAALAVLPDLDENNPNLYDAFIQALKPKVKVKGKEFFHPLRVALTGKIQGPELKKIVPALGLYRLRKRIERALESGEKVQ